MTSVIIPTLNAADTLPRTFASLMPAVLSGLVREVIVIDGGSSDATVAIAEEAGAAVVRAPKGRGIQLHAGARAARGDWLLFLHSDTALEPGFESELAAFQSCEGRFADIAEDRAGAFRFALDDGGIGPGLLGMLVALRCRLFGLPYGDQGLVISRRFYEKLGGYRDMALMEDVDFVRRVGRRRMVMLRSRAVTSAARYREAGYSLRVLRNAVCLSLYFVGVSPGRIARIYG